MQINTSPELVKKNVNNEGEISLRDIAQFLKDGKLWIVSAVVICTVLGVAYAFFASPKYEATAYLEMASVAGVPVETPLILAEKLKLPLYYSIETYKPCRSENKLPSPGQFLIEELRPLVSKNAPIVTIKFQAETANIAQVCLESVVADIRKRQSALMAPILDVKKNQLLTLRQKLDAAERLITLLPIKKGRFVFDDTKPSGSALLLGTLLAKDNETRELRSQINDLQIALAEPQTKLTTLVTPIYAPNVKVEPKPVFVILVAVLGGLVLGVLLWAGKILFSSGPTA